jgi:hypothetical protein
MGFLEENYKAIAWILLWAWIALTIFLLALSPKGWKIYIINLLLLAGFVYFMFFFEP